MDNILSIATINQRSVIKEVAILNLDSVDKTLKYEELKDYTVLNNVVDGKESKVYKKTTPITKGDDVKAIQTALLTMKINIGSDGVDGKYAKAAVEIFQKTTNQPIKPINIHGLSLMVWWVKIP